jgi:hypothetical protein
MILPPPSDVADRIAPYPQTPTEYGMSYATPYNDLLHRLLRMRLLQLCALEQFKVRQVTVSDIQFHRLDTFADTVKQANIRVSEFRREQRQ